MAAPFLPLTRPTIDEETIAGVADVLRSGWITSGPKVREFEAQLSARCGGRPVRAFNSGTCTMEVALRLAGIGPGAHGRRAGLATIRHKKPENFLNAVTRNRHGAQSEEALSPAERAREALLMGLRLAEGVDLADIVADSKREALNARLIHTAKNLKETFGLTPYLIHAYPSIPALMTTTPDIVSPAEFQEELKSYRKKALQNLATQHNMDPAHTILAEGPIEVVVSQTAEDLFADWVIMGSHARAGASGFFIGNTAEALLERTSRNMLVIPQKTPETQNT